MGAAGSTGCTGDKSSAERLKKFQSLPTKRAVLGLQTSWPPTMLSPATH